MSLPPLVRRSAVGQNWIQRIGRGILNSWGSTLEGLTRSLLLKTVCKITASTYWTPHIHLDRMFVKRDPQYTVVRREESVCTRLWTQPVRTCDFINRESVPWAAGHDGHVGEIVSRLILPPVTKPNVDFPSAAPCNVIFAVICDTGEQCTANDDDVRILPAFAVVQALCRTRLKQRLQYMWHCQRHGIKN